MAREKIASLFLGNRLRQLRKNSGVSGALTLAEKMNGAYSAATILRREAGLLKIDLSYIETFAKSLKLSAEEKEHLEIDFRIALLRAKNDTKKIAQAYLELIKQARTHWVYTSGIIPGQLQTFEYATAIIKAYGNYEDPSGPARNRIELARQNLNNSHRQARLVLWEPALYTTYGTVNTMLDQLQALLRFSENSSFEFRVLPQDVFATVPLHGSFDLVDEGYCICSSLIGAVTSEDPATAEKLKSVFERIWENSIAGAAREKIIQKAIAHYEKIK
jgi:hypothetical protein